MKKIAVLYSGCGHQDGAEITEVVSILVNIQKNHAEPVCFSLDQEVSVFDHKNQKHKTSEKRNMLEESARISRGRSKDLKSARVEDFDALIIGGGTGCALHFSDWAEKGSQCKVNPLVEKTISDFYRQEKPIAAVCIAPVLLAKVLGSQKITITLGKDDGHLFNEVRKTGAMVFECPADDYITDREHRILTSPGFMYDTTFDQVFLGIEKLVKEFVEMA